MHLIEFPEQDFIIAKNQKPYAPLPCYRFLDDRGTIVCCWKLTWRERFRLLFTGKVWHEILTFNQSLQPQLLLVEKPDMPYKDLDYDNAPKKKVEKPTHSGDVPSLT